MSWHAYVSSYITEDVVKNVEAIFLSYGSRGTTQVYGKYPDPSNGQNLAVDAASQALMDTFSKDCDDPACPFQAMGIHYGDRKFTFLKKLQGEVEADTFMEKIPDPESKEQRRSILGIKIPSPSQEGGFYLVYVNKKGIKPEHVINCFKTHYTMLNNAVNPYQQQ